MHGIAVRGSLTLAEPMLFALDRSRYPSFPTDCKAMAISLIGLWIDL